MGSSTLSLIINLSSQDLNYVQIIYKHSFSASNLDFIEQRHIIEKQSTANNLYYMVMMCLLVAMTLLLLSNTILVAYFMQKIKRPEEVIILAHISIPVTSSTLPENFRQGINRGKISMRWFHYRQTATMARKTSTMSCTSYQRLTSRGPTPTLPGAIDFEFDY